MAVEITGTAFCDKNTWGTGNSASFSPSKINDGIPTTIWYSSSQSAAESIQNFVGIKFDGLRDIVDVTVNISAWGRNFSIGTWNPALDPASATFTKADIIPVYVHDVITTPNDADGAAIELYKNFRFPAVALACPGILFYCDNSDASVLSGWGIDRPNLILGIGEVVLRGGFVDGQNPKPPTIVPALPFSATPTGWTRTEYSTPGDFVFTPAVGTTLVLAVLQGAGSAGHIKHDLLGNIIAYSSTADGDDTTITNSDGLMHKVTGAKRIQAGDIIDGTTTIPVDWLRKAIGGNPATGGETAPGSVAAGGAGGTQLGGKATAGWLMSAITPKIAPVTNFRVSDGSTSGWVVASSDQFLHNTTNGWQSQNKAINTVGFIQFQDVEVVKGQIFIFSVFASANGASYADLYLNGARVIHQAGTINAQVKYTYTAPADGVLTVRFEFTRGTDPAYNATAAYFQIIEASNSNYPATLAGSCGRYGSLYFTPQVLNLHVGAGGKGIASGQTVPVAAKGTLGSAGAGGADGGDGVIIIYEYAGSAIYQKPVEPVTLLQVNVQSEVVGFYRTEYAARGAAVDGEQSAFKHTLRPRTKNVIALIVGAGGSSSNAWATSTKAGDTTIYTDTKSFTAGGGWRGYRDTTVSTESQPGAGGVFSSETDPVLFKDGSQGARPTANTPNPSGIVANYGNGTTSSLNGIAGGGAGAYAIVVLASDDFNADRTIDLLVGNLVLGGTPGVAGAVFIYETETEFGITTTQMSELILRKDAVPLTNVTQTSELVLQKSGIGGTATTQTAELILQKSAWADRRVTQVAELILVKESDEVDLQVSNAYAALIFDAPDVAINVTQTTEMVLQKSAYGITNVTQTSEMVLQKSARSPYRTTQVSQLFLVAETPTIFWLNFGALDNPVRFQLYDSAVGRASSVPPNCKIQIEGFFAEGTHLVVNGVESGTLADVKNNDRVYIHGGVTNYWQTNMPVYAYYEENGETARMLVGNWLINQPELVPLVTKAYYGSKLTPTWLKTRAGVSVATLQTMATRASMGTVAMQSIITRAAMRAVALQSIVTKAVMSLVQLATTAVQHKFGKLVDLLPEKTVANTRVSDVTIGWDITKALTKVYSVSSVYTQALSTDEKNVVTWGKYDAHTHSYAQAGYIDAKANYGDVAVAYDVRSDTTVYSAKGESILLSVNYAHFETETEQTQASYGDYTVKDFDKTSVNYADVAQEYEYYNADHSVTYEGVYIAVSGSSVARLFSMEPMGTVAYSVLNGMEWERSTALGTGIWIIPLQSALNPQAKFGVFSAAGMDSNRGHSEYSQRETEVINGPQQGYFSTTSMWVQTYSVYAEHESVKRSEKSVTFDVMPTKTVAKTGVFNLTPFLAMQKPNGIGKASLYKGFDTKAEVDQFTENFAGVHTAMKYNGYVYTLDVDKSFICEIFNNGPVKWLLQGG